MSFSGNESPAPVDTAGVNHGAEGRDRRESSGMCACIGLGIRCRPHHPAHLGILSGRFTRVDRRKQSIIRVPGCS